MRHVLSQAYREIVDFGRRPLSMEDLTRECESRGIILSEVGMTELHGLAWSHEGRRHICLNKFLYPEAKLWAGLHELAHHIFHVTDQKMLRSRGRLSNDDRIEAEADAVAVIAMLPFPPESSAAESNLEWARYRLFQNYWV